MNAETGEKNGRGKSREALFTVAAVLFGMLFLAGHGVYSAKVNSVTADEYVHLPAAVSVLQTGSAELDSAGSPPLRALLALPVLAAAPATDYSSDYWRLKETYPFSWSFLRDNFQRYHYLFFIARMSSLFLSLALCLMIFFATAKLFGRKAGAIAALLFCFNPETLAHSSLMTVDMLTACFFLPLFSVSYVFCCAPERSVFCSWA